MLLYAMLRCKTFAGDHLSSARLKNHRSLFDRAETAEAHQASRLQSAGFRNTSLGGSRVDLTKEKALPLFCYT
jgi:hypothetical protein